MFSRPDLFNVPHEFFTLAVVILLLGMKHGLDADHLAAIDGLTRANAKRRPRLARFAGVLFSLGHGTIVFAVAICTSAMTKAWRVPEWLDAFGTWVSIVVLIGLALINIMSVITAPAHETAQVLGWRTGWFARALTVGSAPLILGVGALFAISFDTLTQATLFSVASTQFGGFMAAVTLAALFVLGMFLTDGANGIWIARLIRRSDRTALVASRMMGLTVAGVGLLTAGMGIAFQLNARAQQWGDGKELWFGASVIVVVLTSYALAMRLTQRAPLPICSLPKA
jgi:high-affinity nickel-transport protein